MTAVQAAKPNAAVLCALGQQYIPYSNCNQWAVVAELVNLSNHSTAQRHRLLQTSQCIMQAMLCTAEGIRK